MKAYWMDQADARELEAIDTLDNLTDNVDNVKRELNRKLSLAQKYGYDEYADELALLLEKLDTLRKSRR